MVWLSKPEKNKKYPNYSEVMYDPYKSETVLDIEEGRFFKTDSGYVLLAVINSISDIKPESNIPGTAISLELFNREYERFVNSDNPNAKTTPSKMQKILCSHLDEITNLDPNSLEYEDEPLRQNFKGLFTYTSSTIISELIEINPNTIRAYVFKGIVATSPNKIPESLPGGSGGSKKGGGFSSQSEQQRLEHRLNFVHKALAPYASNPNEFKADIASIASLLAALAADETEFGAVLNREVRWLINLVLGGSK